MVGSLFADTIKYTYKDKLKVKENVTFDRADDQYIHYITSSRTFSKIQCNDVVEIISDNGDKIDFSCSKTSSIIEKTHNKKSSEDKPISTKKFTKRQVGGAFISLGAFNLYNNLDKTCEDLHHYQVESCFDDINESRKWGYVFIFLGGLLILFDSEDIGKSNNMNPPTKNQALNFNIQPAYQGANLTMSYSFK